MKSIETEKEYQAFILERLTQDNGYVLRTNQNFDRYYALDREMLLQFLEATQPEAMEKLRKIFKDKTEDTIIGAISAAETQKGGSRLEVLKHGLEINRIHLNLLYGKPATTYNKELNKLYQENIFSVAEEIWASDQERIDVVIFINGLAVITMELKANTQGQSYKDAIWQYRNDSSRDFNYAYYENIDDALVAGYEQNENFFQLLLNDADLKREVFGVFAGEVYEAFRAAENAGDYNLPENPGGVHSTSN